MPVAGNKIRSSADSFLQLLTGINLAYRRDHDPAALKKILNQAKLGSKDLATKYGLDPEPFHRAIAYLAKGKNISDGEGNPSTPYRHILDEVHQELNKDRRKWLSDPNITPSQVKLANNLIRMMGTDEPEDIARHEKNVEVNLKAIENPQLRQMYSPQKVDQSPIIRDLKSVVKRLTGRTNAIELTRAESDKFKGERYKDKPDVKLYRKLRTQLKQSAKDAVREHIKSKGLDHMPVADVRKHLEKNKIIGHDLRPVFNPLHITSDYKLATTLGHEINAFPTKDFDSTVQYNPNYNPNKDNGYVFKYGDTNVAQTVKRRMGRDKAKFEEKVEPTAEIWDSKVKPRIKRDLLSSDTHRQMMGLILHLLDEHVARIGTNPSDSKGLTTWRVKQMSTARADGSVRISYLGKKDVQQAHVIKPNNIENKRSIYLLKNLVKGKKPSDFIFTEGNKRITPTQVNSYLQQDLKLPITAHKVRNIKATMMMRDLVASKPLKKKVSQAEAEKHFKNLALTVAERLGHYGSTGKVTPTTAIKNYVSPAIGKNYFTSRGYRVPEWLTKVYE